MIPNSFSLNNIIHLLYMLIYRLYKVFINFEHLLSSTNMIIYLILIILYLLYFIHNAYNKWDYRTYIDNKTNKILYYILYPIMILSVYMYISNMVYINFTFSYIQCILYIIPIIIYFAFLYMSETILLLPMLIHTTFLFISQNLIFNYLITVYSIIMHIPIHLNKKYEIKHFIYGILHILMTLIFYFMYLYKHIEVSIIILFYIANILCYYLSNMMRLLQKNTIFSHIFNHLLYFSSFIFNIYKQEHIHIIFILNNVLSYSHNNKLLPENTYIPDNLVYILILMIISILTNTINIFIVVFNIYIITKLNLIYNNVSNNIIQLIVYIILLFFILLKPILYINIKSVLCHVIYFLGLYNLHNDYKKILSQEHRIMYYGLYLSATFITSINDIFSIIVLITLYYSHKYRPYIFYTFSYIIQYTIYIKFITFIINNNILSMIEGLQLMLMYTTFHKMKNKLYHLLFIVLILSLISTYNMIYHYILHINVFNNNIISLFNLSIPFNFAYILKFYDIYISFIMEIVIFKGMFSNIVWKEELLYASFGGFIFTLLFGLIYTSAPLYIICIFKMLNIFSTLYLWIYCLNMFNNIYYYLMILSIITLGSVSLYSLPIYFTSIIPILLIVYKNKSYMRYILLFIIFIWLLLWYFYL